MKKLTVLFLTSLFLVPFGAAFGASCSSLSLIKCLDSGCAVNIGANPAARCQLCGSSAAGTAPSAKSTGLKSLSLNKSSSTTLSEDELSDAPSIAADRYIWVSEQCLQKNKNCTPDDIDKHYDKLITQSCKAALNTLNFSSASKSLSVEKTESVCSSDIYSCITKDLHCKSNFSGCEEDTDFEKFFNSCQVTAKGCEKFTKAIKDDLISTRKNIKKSFENIVTNYQEKREADTIAGEKNCKNNASFNACVKQACANTMRNKCEPGFEEEKTMAMKLCDFHKTACELMGK